MAMTCKSWTRGGRRRTAFASKRPERFLRPVLERLEERTLLSGDLQPPIVLMERPVSHDPDHPDVVPTPVIEIRAVASDESTGNSGIREEGFKFEFKEKLPGSSWSPWTSYTGFNTQVSPPINNETTVATLFRLVPNITFGFRVSAVDGEGNRGVSDETYARTDFIDGPPDIVIVIDNSG